ncbi:MAG: EAL domain-containing protein, partial [Desulfitobacterium sp.]|nr:EAL domain-containing protein [Desulfitobacterium sp.]
EKPSLKDNIDIAFKFNPQATKVVGIVEDSISGIGEREQFKNTQMYFSNLEFSELNISHYSFTEMGEILQTIQEDTILLFLSMHTDKEGEYKDIKEAAQFIAANTNVPVYRPSIGGVGDGILGGKMISYVESGKIAGDMVLQVLSGKPINTINLVTKSPNFYFFDYAVIEKFGIDPNLIPKDAILINKEKSFFEENPALVIGTISVLLLFTFISAFLGVSNANYRNIERKLRESNEELTSTYEELVATEEELRDQYEMIEKNAQRLELIMEKYEHAINSTNSVVWELNRDKGIINFSDNIEKVVALPLGMSEDIDEILGTVIDEKYRRQLLKEIRIYESGKKDEVNIQVPVKGVDNRYRWLKIQGKAIKRKDDERGILYGILTDVTESRKHEDEINRLAYFDFLTNLPNRRNFKGKLQEEIEKGQEFSIMMMDIDNFKEINDTLGHIFGDIVLQEIAGRLMGVSNERVLLSRYGGDEFLILVIGDKNEVLEVIVRIWELFDEPISVQNRDLNIRFSIGIATFPKDGHDIDQLLTNVDTALYTVKRRGKNNYLFYDREMQEELKKKAEIENILRKALNEDGFYLVYQPQVDAQTGEIIGFEALVRLKDHNIPPNVFIAIAEESDLIYQIGKVVTEKAIQQAAEWRDKGYGNKPIAINFSSKQIHDHEYIEFLLENLRQAQLEPQSIEIEITESILMEETEQTFRVLQQLKDLGIKLSLDDFGTGFSSINYLTYIPVHKVKLDKSMCDKFLGMENSKAMESVISLAFGLGLAVTAEGIEEEWQYIRLKESGCNYIQGYLFSKPLLPEEVEKIYHKNFLRDNNS